MAVAFCISGHGFGHASRQVEVINAFGALRPDQPVIVCTRASRWLLDRTIRVPVTIVEEALDTGAIQHDSLAIDIPATLDIASRFEAGADTRAAALAARLCAQGVRVVVSDAPPLASTAARLAGAASVVLANFTWDWIYEDLAADHPEHGELPARLGARYAETDAAWRLPMHGGFATFSTVLDYPWIARRSRRDPGDVRRAIGADDSRPLVLISFGGYGVAGMRLAQHADAPYRVVLSGGAAHAPLDTPADALHVDRERLDDLGVRYEDLVAACDVVASKPGYGIVSECVANDTALLYTGRGRFAEYPVMVAQMPGVLRCRYIDNDAMATARWDEDVAALLAQPRPAARPIVNGADVAAGMLSAML